MGKKMEDGHKFIKNTLVSLYGLAIIYMLTTLFLLFVMFAYGGSLTSFFSPLFSLALLALCIYHLKRGSNSARKGALLLFVLGMLSSILVLTLGVDFYFGVYALVVMALSMFGFWNAWGRTAIREALSELAEESIAGR